MRIFVSSRQTGKTYQTIEWFLVDPTYRVVVCINQSECNRLVKDIMKRPPYHNKPRPAWTRNIISYTTLGAGGLRGRTIAAVRIDNLDLFLTDLFRVPLDKLSATSTAPIEVINANPSD